MVTGCHFWPRTIFRTKAGYFNLPVYWYLSYLWDPPFIKTPLFIWNCLIEQSKTALNFYRKKRQHWLLCQPIYTKIQIASKQNVIFLQEFAVTWTLSKHAVPLIPLQYTNELIIPLSKYNIVRCKQHNK